MLTDNNNYVKEEGVGVTTAHKDDLLTVYTMDPTAIVPSHLPSVLDPTYGHNFPLFSLSHVPTIMADPRIRFGLNLIKGPIQAYTVFLPEKEADNPALHETIREQGMQFVFKICSKNPKEEEFIQKTMNQFWLSGLTEALTAIEWGFSCSQTLYVKRKEQLHYKALHLYPHQSVNAILRNNCLIGGRIKGLNGNIGGLDLKVPKIMWHVHGREVNRFYGDSRCRWAFVPWHEMWTIYGARDIRRTWFHRNSFSGGQLQYPIGRTVDRSGQQVDNVVIATGMMANMRTGGYMLFPYEVDQQSGKPKWQYTPPESNITPDGLMEYPETLRKEMLEALGIPPEVVESSGSDGFGSATGRKVPLDAYYASLTPLVNNVIMDFCKFCLDYLMLINFKHREYSIEKVMPIKSQQDLGDGTSTSKVTKTVQDTGF